MGEGIAVATNRSGTAVPQDAEARLLYIDQLLRTIRHFITALTWVAIGYCLFLSADSLAGKSTQLTGALTYVVSAGTVLPWGFAAFCLMWALVERHLRRRTTETLTDRIKRLERRVDPHVNSSGILPSGETHPSDERITG